MRRSEPSVGVYMIIAVAVLGLVSVTVAAVYNVATRTERFVCTHTHLESIYSAASGEYKSVNVCDAGRYECWSEQDDAWFFCTPETP